MTCSTQHLQAPCSAETSHVLHCLPKMALPNRLRSKGLQCFAPSVMWFAGDHQPQRCLAGSCSGPGAAVAAERL